MKSNIRGTKKRSIVSTDTFWHIFCPKEQMEGLLLKWEVWKHRLVFQVNSVVLCLLRDMFFLRHPSSRNTSPDTHFLPFACRKSFSHQMSLHAALVSKEDKTGSQVAWKTAYLSICTLVFDKQAAWNWFFAISVDALLQGRVLRHLHGLRRLE